MNYVLGIAGPAGSGKDTFSDMVTVELNVRGHRAVALSMAAPLKSAMQELFGVDVYGLTRAEKELPHIKLSGRTPREVMQWLGTEFGRTLVGPDVWIRAMQTRIETIPDGVFILIPDIRFVNEVQFARKNGMMLTIDREVAAVAAHSSEGLVAGHLINNQGSLTELRERATVTAMAMIVDRENKEALRAQ